MLGETQIYSCAYFDRGVTGLDQAQHDKKVLLGEKLKLKPGMKVLDIGCGWGDLAIYLAEEHGAEVSGITISKEQLTKARQRARSLAHGSAKFEFLNYEELPGRFAAGSFVRIISVGMFEHVGVDNYDPYFNVCARMLKDEPTDVWGAEADVGFILLHTIIGEGRGHGYNRWVNEYEFPNGHIPTLLQIEQARRKYFRVQEDFHNLNVNYAKTLAAWWDNYLAAWGGSPPEDQNDLVQFRQKQFYL